MSVAYAWERRAFIGLLCSVKTFLHAVTLFCVDGLIATQWQFRLSYMPCPERKCFLNSQPNPVHDSYADCNHQWPQMSN